MILDTNAISAFADNDPGILDVLPRDRPWYIPVVVVGEYRFGILGSREQKRRETWLSNLIGVVPVLDITESTTAHYAAIRLQLKNDGYQIPPNDSWIASLALEHRQPILSKDSHFDRVSGITRLSW